MPNNITRRVALRMIFMATTAFVVTPYALGREYGKGLGMPWEPGVADVPHLGTLPESFLSEHELATVNAIAARLIPTDEDGTGAIEAGVGDFIDRQLASFYGRGQHWYMQGPFSEGLATQGYQQAHPPAQLYRLAIAELDRVLHARHGTAFVNLPIETQDDVLKAMDDEGMEFASVSAKAFFDLILENTIEGFFADPIYGGNRDMVGWRYVGFPGTRYDYRDFVGHNGARIELPPVSLSGGSHWTQQD